MSILANHFIMYTGSDSMRIFLNILFLLIGLVLLIKGADFFVSGASSVARKMRVSSMVIGLTVVAIGTSLPELAVSVTSAINHVTDLSIGNIVGSNMFNMLICLGVVCMFKPIYMRQSTKKVDFPFLIALTTMLLIFSVDKYLDGIDYNFISRTESVILLSMLILYLFVTVSNARKDRTVVVDTTSGAKPETEEVKVLSTTRTVIYLILGLAAVVFGGECVSSTAQYLAISAGMSEALVGITIVAFGTSLPELVTSIVAARKGENELALGNVIGSNIMNIALILGSVGIITQIPITLDMLIDLGILLGSTIIFIGLCLRKGELRKKEGFILITIYVAYIAYAIIRNYVM